MALAMTLTTPSHTSPIFDALVSGLPLLHRLKSQSIISFMIVRLSMR